VGEVEKPLDRFYSYFDPFYFNGPIFNPAFKSPDFKICVPLSEHLYWETNPAQYELVKETMQLPGDLMLLGRPDPKTGYLPWLKSADFGSMDEVKNSEAMKKTAADLVKRCSELSHGDINRDSDFGPVYKDKLALSVRCVATMFRAATTALRGEGWARKTSDGTMRAQLVLDVKTDVPVTLLEARFGTLDPKGQVKSAPGWTLSLGKKTLTPGKPLDIGATIEDVPAGVDVHDFFVDIRADFGTFPDLGRLRIPLGTREAKRVVNPDAGAKLVRTKGPIDVVVFDTTGSMQSSIDSLRDNAIVAIERLKSQTNDIRMAVVTFRDLSEKDDGPFFLTSGFTRNLGTQFAFMRGLKADGGGDPPEDQLDGLSRAIALWEREPQDEDRVPAKVIVTITDAPAKVPDAAGNTFESIKARADAVDPAHIYPIIVGSNVDAAAHAKVLADTTGGKVLTVANGEAVAAALMEAVGTAVIEHGGDEPPRRAGKVFVVLWLVLAVLALGAIPLVLWVGRGKRRASSKAPAVVHSGEHVVWDADGDSAAVEPMAGHAKRRTWAWVLIAAGGAAGIALLVVGLVRAPGTRASVEFAVKTEGPVAPIARPAWRPDELATDTYAINAEGHVVRERKPGLATFDAWRAAYLASPPVMNDPFPPSPSMPEHAVELSARPPSEGVKLPRLKRRLGDAEPTPTPEKPAAPAVLEPVLESTSATAEPGFAGLARFVPAESWLVIGLDLPALRRLPLLAKAADALEQGLGETTPLATIGGRELVHACERVLYAGAIEGVDPSEEFVFAGEAAGGWTAIKDRLLAAGATAIEGPSPWWSLPTGEAVMVEGTRFAAARRGSAGKLVAARAGAWLGPTSALGAMLDVVRGGAALFAALRVTAPIASELDQVAPGLGRMSVVGVQVAIGANAGDGLAVTIRGELLDADAATFALASLTRVRDRLPGSPGKALLERVVATSSGATLTLTLRLGEDELGALVRDADLNP